MSAKVVVDTSIALKWALVEDDSPLALALAREWNAQGLMMIAPTLLAYEVANTLRQKVRAGKMTADEARDALARVLSGGLVLDKQDQAQQAVQSERALALANQLDLSATYDAHYLALAEREGCEYWTADERLWNAVKSHLPWVRWLGERTAPAPTASPPTA